MVETQPEVRTPKASEKVSEMIQITASVVSSYLSKNTVTPAQLPEVIKTIHASLVSLGSASAPTATPSPSLSSKGQKPAVNVKKSITPEYIICLEDGRKLKMLKRHLRKVYNMSPEQYRAKWNLPNDYPMVAPKYAEQRSKFAKEIGLGKGSTGRRGSRTKKTAA